ncbi:MAG TPA: hypothetical protein VN803_01055 [Gemmatimonadales bacterium]|nr:hypothetical protein [Gemmatimonadales bacterium]
MSFKRRRALEALKRSIERTEQQVPEVAPAHFRGTILDALDAAGMTGASWAAWRTFWKAVYALKMSAVELAIFEKQTGRKLPPAKPVTEAWLIVGRRGGKSRNDALAAMYAGVRRDYRKVLAPGERATVPIIATDRRQARTVMRYLKGLAVLPAFKPFVARVLTESVELRTGAVIEVHTASFRSTRGYTLAGAIADEVAFWRTEDSETPDEEILGALRPGMATLSDAVLLGSSTPYARRGVLWQAFERHYGRDDSDVLVWKASTREMNPALAEHVVTRAYEDDSAAAAAEYGAEFRRDIEAFLSAEAVDGVRVAGRRELPREAGRRYVAFADPSGGSQDAFTLAIAHREGDRGVLDLIRERHPPFSPDDVCREFAAVLRSYGVSQVHGDRYAGEWPRERFAAHGIAYRTADWPKNELYRLMLPLVNAGRVELLDHSVLRAQLLGLERRVARSGRDSIDHAPGAHDDTANAAAGALVLAAGTARPAWRVSKVEVGWGGVRVLNRLPQIAIEFGLDGPCGDPVTGEGRLV